MDIDITKAIVLIAGTDKSLTSIADFMGYNNLTEMALQITNEYYVHPVAIRKEITPKLNLTHPGFDYYHDITDIPLSSGFSLRMYKTLGGVEPYALTGSNKERMINLVVTTGLCTDEEVGYLSCFGGKVTIDGTLCIVLDSRSPGLHYFFVLK
jgi:hypothetical protein